ncbi:hypothetical protein TNCV_4905041 [Trichonephila clavipes]|uniref:Uncharacterized protein n=1 Tax=Trichonephila clavipes TaxID=2585209 RepID=A0A8X6RMZ8_TRICX|nr:hypothetical protein TNCV_4905041 [Trichonephila clavipes]
MPQKRKSNLSQGSNIARAKKVARFKETFPQAELRKLEHAERETGHRAAEILGQSQDRVVVYSASTPQVWGSINGLLKVDSAFHPRYIGSINEYQACFGSLFRQTTKSRHLFMHLSVKWSRVL